MSGLFLCHFCTMKTRITGFADLRKWAIFLLVISLLSTILFGYILTIVFKSISDFERILLQNPFSIKTLEDSAPLFYFISSMTSVSFLLQLIRKSYGFNSRDRENILLDEGLIAIADKIRLRLSWWILYVSHGLFYCISSSYFIYTTYNSDTPRAGVYVLFGILLLFGIGSIAYIVALAKSSCVNIKS